MLSRTLIVAALVASHATTQCSQCSKEESGSRAADGEAPASSSRIASCDRVPAMSVCSEYAGAYLAQNEAVLSASCGKLGGTFVAARCPNTAVLGSCTLSTSEVRVFYASGAAAYDAARAQKECESSYRGTWTAFK